VREELLRSGGEWWECRSANAAMWALAESGVKFGVITHADGSRERWREPKLAPWEVPRRDPRESRPRSPEVRAARRFMAMHADMLRALLDELSKRLVVANGSAVKLSWTQAVRVLNSVANEHPQLTVMAAALRRAMGA
jgi:hypothetical protein